MTSDQTSQYAARVDSNVAPTAPNKAQSKWHQRGGAALALSPRIQRNGPLIIKRGLEKMKLKRAPNAGARRWHENPAYGFERAPAECAPPAVAPKHASLPYDGKQPITPVPAVHPGFAKLERFSSPSKIISPNNNISPNKRSALRVKSKIGAVGGIRARKWNASGKNGPACAQPRKRSRAVIPSGLGDLLGKVKSVGTNTKARSKKTRVQEDRRTINTFKRRVESNDEMRMQLCTPTTDVEMLPCSATSPGFRWRTCFAFLSSTWRERRDSVDSAYSNLPPVSPDDSGILLGRPGHLDFLFEDDVECGSDKEIEKYTPDEDPFEQPLPSATPSGVSMASVDEDSEDDPTTLTTSNSNVSAHQTLRSQHDQTRLRMAKLSQFFGPEVLRDL